MPGPFPRTSHQLWQYAPTAGDDSAEKTRCTPRRWISRPQVTGITPPLPGLAGSGRAHSDPSPAELMRFSCFQQLPSEHPDDASSRTGNHYRRSPAFRGEACGNAHWTSQPEIVLHSTSKVRSSIGLPDGCTSAQQTRIRQTRVAGPQQSFASTEKGSEPSPSTRTPGAA